MSKAFKSIKKGLQEAIDYAEGKDIKARVFEPKEIDIKILRAEQKMTQIEFSARIGISVSTLRHWERGDRHPSGPALVLLNLIEKQPRLVFSSLQNN